MQIAGYKVPRSVWLVEQISRTPAGKADYRWARGYAEEQLAAGRSHAAGAGTETAGAETGGAATGDAKTGDAKTEDAEAGVPGSESA
jgi:hypothetical protein